MIVGVVAGCSSNNSSSTSAPAATTAAAAATTAAAAATTAAATTNDYASTVDTYTIFVSGGAATQFNWSNPVAQAITAKTGVALNPDVCLDSNPNDKLNLMLASGVYDDIVQGIQPSDMPNWVNANALVALDSYIAQSPNLLAFYGPYVDRLKFNTTYPYIYGFGSGHSTAASFEPGNYWQTCFMIQQGALKAQGYPLPKTLSDYENIIKTDLTNNPTTPDGLKKVGLDPVFSDGWRYSMPIGAGYYVNGICGGDVYLDPTTNTLMDGRVQPFYHDWMQWLNKLYNEGLIDPQFSTQTYDDYIAELSSGVCVGCIDGYWQMYNADITLRQGAHPEEGYFPFPILQDPSMTWLQDQPGNMINNGGLTVTTHCNNPAKLTAFMDYLASEEGQILRWWGIEGTNYTIDSNGNRVMNQADQDQFNANMIGYEQTSGVQMYANDGGQWLDEPYGWTTSNGQQLCTTSNLAMAYNSTDLATLQAYGVKDMDEMFPDPAKLPVMKYGTISSLPTGLTDETNAIKTQIGNDSEPGIINMITCSSDQFEAQWQTWVTTMTNDGYQKILDETNASLQDRIKLWGLSN
jgi:putative aldouronate transport system substrate-binding protein